MWGLNRSLSLSNFANYLIQSFAELFSICISVNHIKSENESGFFWCVVNTSSFNFLKTSAKLGYQEAWVLYEKPHLIHYNKEQRHKNIEVYSAFEEYTQFDFSNLSLIQLHDIL